MAVQVYRQELAKVKGLFFRYNRKEIYFPRNRFYALGMIELSPSVLIDVRSKNVNESEIFIE